jgi:hypothetical protein
MTLSQTRKRKPESSKSSAPAARPGAPDGNTNAVKHGAYALGTAAKRRQRTLRGQVSRLRRHYPHLAAQPAAHASG